MFDFAEGHGQKEFGFGKGQSYCAAYGRKVLETGGAKLKDWNVEKLMKEANKAIMTYGPLALKYVEKLIEKKGNRVTATILFFLNTELIRSLSPQLDFRYRLPGTGVKPPHGASSVEVEK